MNKKNNNEQVLLTPEWTCLFDTEKVERTPYTLTIEPTQDEKLAIAKRLGLEALDELTVKLVLQRNPGNMVIHIHGLLSATVSQKCVVTLEPMKEKIETEFEAWYADASQAVSFTRAKRERELEKDNIEKPVLDESEDPEPIVNGNIDLGELAVQHLSLNLNPYPRKQDAIFASGEKQILKTQGNGDIYSNPFEALKNWREKESKN